MKTWNAVIDIGAMDVGKSDWNKVSPEVPFLPQCCKDAFGITRHGDRLDFSSNRTDAAEIAQYCTEMRIFVLTLQSNTKNIRSTLFLDKTCRTIACCSWSMLQRFMLDDTVWWRLNAKRFATLCNLGCSWRPGCLLHCLQAGVRSAVYWAHKVLTCWWAWEYSEDKTINEDDLTSGIVCCWCCEN